MIFEVVTIYREKGAGQGERERRNLKQAPCSMHSLLQG